LQKISSKTFRETKEQDYKFVNVKDLNNINYFIQNREEQFSDKEVKSKTGKKHKDSAMRKFRDLEEKYLNRWELLGLD